MPKHEPSTFTVLEVAGIWNSLTTEHQDIIKAECDRLDEPLGTFLDSWLQPNGNGWGNLTDPPGHDAFLAADRARRRLRHIGAEDELRAVLELFDEPQAPSDTDPPEMPIPTVKVVMDPPTPTAPAVTPVIEPASATPAVPPTSEPVVAPGLKAQADAWAAEHPTWGQRKLYQEWNADPDRPRIPRKAFRTLAPNY